VLWVFVCLLALAAVSYGLSFARLGALSLVVALAIAALKALLVLFAFMEFGELSASAKLAAFAALLMLLLLVAFMAADIGTREPSPLLPNPKVSSFGCSVKRARRPALPAPSVNAWRASDGESVAWPA